MARHLEHRWSVERAAAEHDQLGRERFLAEHGFGAARKYLVRINGRLYDSKAIVGVAHGYEYPDLGPLASSEFSGGVSPGAAAWQLERLGFEIVAVGVR